MEFPHGHHHHRPGHYRPDEESYPPANQHYPPSSFDEPPPPPQVTHVGHSSPYNEFGGGRDSYSPPPPPHAVNYGYGPPPPPAVDYGYGPPPPPDFGYAPPPPAANSGGYSSVEHVSHQSPPPPAVDYGYAPPPPPAANSGGYSSVEHVSHQSHRPHLPSFVHHHSHSSPEISNKRSVRVYTKAEPNFSLTIRDGKVILARSDPSDTYQHWIKEEKFSTKVKDEQGFPSFALINKATGQALKHSTGATHPVQLIPYNPDVLDESILWTESKDLGDTYRTVRMVNNIRLNVDALNGDQNHGGVHDGTKIVLWEWKKGDNQRWKIVPYCKSSVFKSWHFPFFASPPCSIKTLKKYELPSYFCSFNASDDTCRMSACLAKKLLYGYGAVFLICKSGCFFPPADCVLPINYLICACRL